MSTPFDDDLDELATPSLDELLDELMDELLDELLDALERDKASRRRPIGLALDRAAHTDRGAELGTIGPIRRRRSTDLGRWALRNVAGRPWAETIPDAKGGARSLPCFRRGRGA